MGSNKRLYEKGYKLGNLIYGGKYEQLVEFLRKHDKEFARYLVEHTFGEVLSRKGLNLKTRMLCNVAALTALGIELLLKNYIKAALFVGASYQEVKEVIIQMHVYAGWPRSVVALRVFDEASQELQAERESK